jgi:hypothetical protein
MRIQALYNANSAVSRPQLVGDAYWTGVVPLATYSVAATPDVSANAFGLKSPLVTWMPLVGREPNFNHTHISGQVGVDCARAQCECT